MITAKPYSFLPALYFVGFSLLAPTPIRASTDLTDFLPPREYAQQQHYAARTDCELHPGRTEPAKPESKPVAVTPVKPSLLEQLTEALEGDCGKVRMDNNQLICEDYVSCAKEVKIEPEEEICIEYCCPCGAKMLCVEKNYQERWRFDPTKVGMVEALLIEDNRPHPRNSLEFSIRPMGKKEMYTLRSESTARQLKEIFNTHVKR